MNDAASISSELERAGCMIDACGESAKRGELVDLSGLDTTMEGLCQDLMGLPEAERIPLKPRLIDLIDRLNKLIDDLKTQQTLVSDDIKDLSSRHRAVSAYSKGANTSAPEVPSTPPERGAKR